MLLLASLQGLSNKISDYQKQYEKELTTSISYCDTRYSMLYWASIANRERDADAISTSPLVFKGVFAAQTYIDNRHDKK